jgi:hypothetical protein
MRIGEARQDSVSAGCALHVDASSYETGLGPAKIRWSIG